MVFRNFDAFDEGVAPGGARTKTEIRTLLCYVFYSIGKPLSRDVAVTALQKHSLANYFETADCFNDLVRLGNLELADEENGLYQLTENGKMIARQLEDTLPLTMKEKAYRDAMELLENQRIARENPVTVVPENEGFRVSCTISDGSMDLLTVSVFAASKDQVKLIRRNFHHNPEMFYKIIISLLSNNRDLAVDALKTIEISGN